MRKLCKKIVLIILSISLLSALFANCVLASDASEVVDSFSNGGDRIICIAHRGDWHSFPENSVESVNAALEYDAVSIDVKLTSDGIPVLMADETVDRMCVNAEGGSVSGKVSSFTLAQIKELYLRESNGGTDKKKTECLVPELKEIYDLANGNTAIVLNVGEADFSAVYSYVKNLGKLGETVFRIDAKTKQIIKLTKDIDDVTVIGNYQGNIYFSAVSAIKSCSSNKINTIELGSPNGKGILYGSFLMKRFNGSVRAMVSMVNGRSGEREDNETGWDSLISCGYSVIETDFPAELTDYITRTEAAATDLERYVDLYQNTDLSPYDTKSEKEFTSALTSAQKLIGSPNSLSNISEVRSALRTAYDSLTVGEKKGVSLKFDFTPLRIIIVLIFAVLFTTVSIYLRRKRKTD